MIITILFYQPFIFYYNNISYIDIQFCLFKTLFIYPLKNIIYYLSLNIK